MKYYVGPALLVLSLLIYYFQGSADDPIRRIAAMAARLVQEGAPTALMAVGAGLVLATGSVDISTAGVATAGGIVFAACIQVGSPWWCATLAAVATGVASGVLVGLAVRRGAPPLILSWAAGSLWIIAALVFAEKQVVESTPTQVSLGKTVADSYWSVTGGGFRRGILTATLVAIGLRLSNLPVRACALGADRDSAVFAGVRTSRILVLAFAFSGACAALAGVHWALLNSGAPTTSHLGKELSAVAIAVLGGTVMSGGYFRVLPVLAAAFFWATAETIVAGLDLGFFENQQEYAARAIFALIFLVALPLVGRRLGADTRTIMVEPRTKG